MPEFDPNQAFLIAQSILNSQPRQEGASDYNARIQGGQNLWNQAAAQQWSGRQQAMQQAPELPPQLQQAQQVAQRFDPAGNMGMQGVPGYMRDYAAVRHGQDLMTGADPVAIQHNPLFNDPQFMRLPREMQAPIFERYTGHPLDTALQASQFAAASGAPNMTYADIGKLQNHQAQVKSSGEHLKLLEQSFGFNPAEPAIDWDPVSQTGKIKGKQRFDPQTQSIVTDPDRVVPLPEAVRNSILKHLGNISGAPVRGVPEQQAFIGDQIKQEEARKAHEMAAQYAASHAGARHMPRQIHTPEPQRSTANQIGRTIGDIPNWPQNAAQGLENADDWFVNHTTVPAMNFARDLYRGIKGR